jgi:hypothetical protein
MAEDLDRWPADGPIQARPVGIWERSERWFWKKGWIGAITVAIAAALVLLTMPFNRVLPSKPSPPRSF